jgi:hypothetical protein
LHLYAAQRYNIPIAVHEYFGRKIFRSSLLALFAKNFPLGEQSETLATNGTQEFSIFNLAGHLVILVICQNRKRMLSKPPL